MQGYTISNGHITLKIKYLHREKSGLFIFRRGVPHNLRSVIQKSELKKSLKTHNQVEAAKLIPKLVSWSNNLFQQANSPYERDKAVANLLSRGLEDTTLTRQPIFQDCSPEEEGSPYLELLDDLAAKSSFQGEYDDSRLAPEERRMLAILNGTETHTLEDVKKFALKNVAEDNDKTNAIKRFFKYFEDHNISGDISRIRTVDIHDTVNNLLTGDNPKKTATVQKAVNTLRKAFKDFFHVYELEQRNPFSNIKVPNLHKDEKHRHTFSYKELDIIKKGILDSESESAKIAGVLFDTGCRCAEVSGLRLEDIRLEDEIPHLIITPHTRRLKTKGSERYIPLTGVSLHTAKKIKANSLPEQVYAFPQYFKNNDFKNDSASAAINKWLKSRTSGTSHSFRHKLTDRLKDAGVAWNEIENIQGWSDKRMINSYGITKSLKTLKDALDLMHHYEKNKKLFNN